jgi:3-oxoadipate enol-lactonase
MTQAIATYDLSHGPKNRPTLLFLPAALIRPNALAPVTRMVKLRAIGVGRVEGAAPYDLHSVAERVATLLKEVGPTC